MTSFTSCSFSPAAGVVVPPGQLAARDSAWGSAAGRPEQALGPLPKRGAANVRAEQPKNRGQKLQKICHTEAELY